MKKSAPFSRSYVVRRTLDGMKNAVSFSMRKTLSRLEDFEPEDPKRQEILDTLNVLNYMNRLVDEFENNNKHLIQEEDEQ